MPWTQSGKTWRHNCIPYVIRESKLEVNAHAVRYTVHTTDGEFLAARWRLTQATEYCEDRWRLLEAPIEGVERPMASTETRKQWRRSHSEAHNEDILLHATDSTVCIAQENPKEGDFKIFRWVRAATDSDSKGWPNRDEEAMQGQWTTEEEAIAAFAGYRRTLDG